MLFHSFFIFIVTFNVEIGHCGLGQPVAGGLAVPDGVVERVALSF